MDRVNHGENADAVMRDLWFPNIRDGAEGVRFIENCVRSVGCRQCVGRLPVSIRQRGKNTDRSSLNIEQHSVLQNKYCIHACLTNGVLFVVSCDTRLQKRIKKSN